ncbi:flagellar assembly protein FliW [Bacillus testis]|uniref:flagellar assembly protein FliW n=1 Tax=Bacillus testis TaxID=1622072 RepID=UPI00067EDAE6|nr:flagellar assembly protein FliW [Bacillus testis]
MKIMTKFHGELEIDQQQLWHFQNGIPGFPDEQQFALYPLGDSDLSVLQSFQNKNVAFVVADPFVFFDRYDFVLEDSVLEQLEVENRSDVMVAVILTLGETIEESTANLQAPVIFNLKNQKAKQVILHDTHYMTKHPLNQQEGKE